MDDEADPLPGLVRRLHTGDPQARRTPCTALFAWRLTWVAERHLSDKLAARLDGDDVVQSVFRTFFRRERRGRVPDRHLFAALAAARQDHPPEGPGQGPAPHGGGPRCRGRGQGRDGPGRSRPSPASLARWKRSCSSIRSRTCSAACRRCTVMSWTCGSRGSAHRRSPHARCFAADRSTGPPLLQETAGGRLARHDWRSKSKMTCYSSVARAQLIVEDPEAFTRSRYPAPEI